MKIEVPAKLNLSLRIKGRREDGFHELETLMVPVPELHDMLEVLPADGFSFTCDGEGLPDDEENLAVRAVRVFEKAVGRDCRFAVSLKKRIPHGAGLGGGSSDAAAVLTVLNAAAQNLLSRDRLEELAGELGSDVPFFLRGSPCWCRGRGELLERAEVEEMDVLLVKPPFAVSTPDAYRRWADSRELAGVCYGEQEVGGLVFVNDLERPVFEKFPYLAELKMWLLGRAGVEAALMSGSGSTVFAVLKEGMDVAGLEEDLRRAMGERLWTWTGRVGE